MISHIMMVTSTQFLVVVMVTVGAIQASSPGFKARITDKGLKYANSVAMKALEQSVKNIQIPGQSGKVSGFHYEVKNIRVTEYSSQDSVINTNPGKGLTWKATINRFAVHGDFTVKKLFVRNSGSFDAGLSNVNFNLAINIGSDSNGRPTISTQSCNSNIGDVNFKFHGSMAWLFNMFRRKVGDAIKKLLSGQMCPLITREINVDGTNRLAKLKVTTPLGKDFLLDYRLSKNPEFTPGFLETFHKGEIFWSQIQKEAPLSVPPMSDNVDTDHMLYLWVSDYMCNTMMYNAQKHGVLLYNLTKHDLPAKDQGVLNATCDNLLPCVGRLIPGISQKFPNSVVDMHMNSTKMPLMKITTGGITMNFEGLINMYANRTGKPLDFLVSLDAKMSVTIDANVQNELLYAKIKDLSVTLKALQTRVGPVSETLLNFLVKQVLNVFLIPKLNDLGQKGFPLPMTGDIQFQNIKLLLEEDALILATDLNYSPSDDEQTLRYRPQQF